MAQRYWLLKTDGVQMHMLPDTPLLLAFVGASLVLALTPGPAVIYIVTRTLAQGRACGLASVLGVALGNLSNAVGAALGLAALFAVSAAAFTLVKWAGAAYLVYLGIRLWQAAPALADATPHARVQPLRRVFRDGFVVALLNPKTTLFFAAFLPQFMDAHGSLLGQTLALGGVFVGIACCTDLLYVLTASLVAPRLNRVARHAVWGNRLAGTSFIGLGVLTAMGTRPAR
jgi:threonine/homoserine/homoserine lactone efflux protein